MPVGQLSSEAGGALVRRVAQGERWLGNQRIGDERDEEAHVRGAVENIPGLCIGMAGAGEPRLQRRRASPAAAKNGRPTEPASSPMSLINSPSVGLRPKPCGTPIRSATKAVAKTRRRSGDRRAETQPAGRKMRVETAGEQRCLGERYRRRPNGGLAAELRQLHLGEHRLRAGQQRRKEERCRGEQHVERPAGRRPRRGGRAGEVENRHSPKPEIAMCARALSLAGRKGRFSLGAPKGRVGLIRPPQPRIRFRKGGARVARTGSQTNVSASRSARRSPASPAARRCRR